MAKHVLIAGGSGFIGTALSKRLLEEGYSVSFLTSNLKKVNLNSYFWDPEKRILDPQVFEGIEIVVNLAGENISSSYWTESFKKKLKNSRISSTSLLVDTICNLKNAPPLFINASAIGYYGEVQQEVVDEKSPPGRGFLADLCKEWEGVLTPLTKGGIRVVKTRFGIVLSPQGGALKKMLPLFKIGLGGQLGKGDQVMSWITLRDVVEGLLHIIGHQSLQGPVNLVSLNPVTNQEFTKILGEVLKRETFLRIPEGVIKFFLGEMGESLLFSSLRVNPLELTLSHFQFQDPKLKEALQHLLKQE